MITGFNTDVRHGDVVFHVQTEDKGTGNPCIESLVYVGGQILARKRAGYRSLLDGAEALKAVAELMERQHRSMIQQIRAGKMDEKVAAIKGGAPARTAPAEPAPTQVAPPADPAPARDAPPAPADPRPEAPPPAAPAKARPAAVAPSRPSAETVAPAPMPPLPAKSKPEARPPSPAPARPTPARPVVAPPKLPSRPPSAVERTDPDAGDRTLDQVILDYLEMESDQERLVLSMNRREGALEAGSEATLEFRTESSIDRDPIGHALITVRLISTIDEPQLLAEGRTDDHGELVLRVVIPDLQAGSGAVIIIAESSIGNTESRHLI